MANATYRGRMIVNDTDYTGSFVDPNPSGVATENLNTVSIDGKIFNVVGSGGGITTYRGFTNPPITLGNEGDIYYKCNGNIVDNYVLIDSTELPADFKFEGGVLLSVTIPNGATKIKLNCYNYGQSPTEIILDFSDIPITNDHPYSGGSQGVQVFSTLWAGKDNNYIYFESATGAYVWVASGYFDIPIYTYTDIIASYNKTNLGWIGSHEYIEDVYVNNESVLDANRIAQIFSHQEVTEQEYGALPKTKESDNIMYCIKGSRPSTNGNYFTPIIYSTEEREVGVWIDNKPLYAKSFTLSSQITVSASSWTNTDLSISDVEKFVNGYAISDDGTFQGSVVVDKSNDVIQLQSTRSTASYVKYLTVFYTKTTDVAGSGSYTTLGVPAVHYSTDEQVIGTWIDGKPLYQKTYNINETILNQDKTIDVSSLNIKKYINGYGTFMRNVNWASPIIYIETPFNLYESNKNHSYLRYGKSSNTIDYGVTLGDNETATDITITIQYTKTS